jgi:predicted Zn-dependent protease with MMP-like domain
LSGEGDREFEELVETALAAIPSPFAERLADVAIVIDDEPAPGQAPPGQTLLGLYQGVPRTAWGADGTAYASRITLFRGPHERLFPDAEARAQAVENTLRHEIAHHLGIDEDHIRSIEVERTRRRRS